MPNHVSNRLTFEGDKAEIDRLLDAVITHRPRTEMKTYWDDEFIYHDADDNPGYYNPETNAFKTHFDGKIQITSTGVPEGWQQQFDEACDEFDFDKIIPMPDDVRATLDAGGLTLKALQRSKGRNWNDWSRDNWNTKWNSYDNAVDDQGRVLFNTAWSEPQPVIQRLSEMFPEVTILHEYFDEGWFLWGSRKYRGGEIIEDNHRNSEWGDIKHDEYAKELCMELKGYDPFDEDEDEGKYMSEKKAKGGGPFPRRKPPDTGSAILELRRLTGLTWDQLSRLFGVARLSLHLWASGKPLNAANEEQLYRTLSVVRAIDRGSASENRALLLQEHESLIPFDLLADGRYEEVVVLVGTGPGRSQPERLPLSPDAQAARAPLPPEVLADARQDIVHRDVGRGRAARTVKAKRRRGEEGT